MLRNVCRSAFFFFQAEDGIRDYKVTGVQTCALPISKEAASRPARRASSRTCPGCGRSVLPQARRAKRLRGPTVPILIESFLAIFLTPRRHRPFGGVLQVLNGEILMRHGADGHGTASCAV